MQNAQDLSKPLGKIHRVNDDGSVGEEHPGQRSSVADNGYYLTVERDFDRTSFGGEWFRVGPLYTTELRTYIGRDEADLFGNPIAYNNTMVHRLVEDNDDDDRYPDSWYNNAPSRSQGQSDIVPRRFHRTL